MTFVLDFSRARKIKKEEEGEGRRRKKRETECTVNVESVNSGTQEVYKDCLLLMIFPNAHPWIHRNAVIRSCVVNDRLA